MGKKRRIKCQKRFMNKYSQHPVLRAKLDVVAEKEAEPPVLEVAETAPVEVTKQTVKTEPIVKKTVEAKTPVKEVAKKKAVSKSVVKKTTKPAKKS